jgi:hypothetical protein
VDFQALELYSISIMITTKEKKRKNNERTPFINSFFFLESIYSLISKDVKNKLLNKDSK